MTRQTWTAFVAAIAFVLTAVGLVVLPVPYVSWTPGLTANTLGSVRNRPVIDISGISTYPTKGQLDLTTVSETRPDARLSLPEALLSYWLPNRDTLPRELIYPPGKTAEQVNSESRVMMETSQGNAVVAALRAAGQPVTQRPAVASVTVGSAAYNHLQPGDLILSINGKPVTSNQEAEDLIRNQATGGSLVFDVIRDRKERVVKFYSGKDADSDLSGITIGDGYDYKPRISFDLGEQIGGPSAGLVFSLAIYDKITPGALIGNRRVAGTGTINAAGAVGAIGGIQQKIAGAANAGASVFLVPAANCGDLAGVRTHLELVKVASLQDAIDAMNAIRTGSGKLPRCAR
ncbi:MAG: PDZ domain-containing protein [Microlunatus sp.]|nr:PDZ domain-containing protein [Microlunatus sp.]